MEQAWDVKGTFFHTALAQMKERGALPEKDSFLYRVITEDLRTWITPWRHYAAAWTFVLGAILWWGGLIFTIVTHNPNGGYGIVLGTVIVLCVSWPLMMNGGDPVEIILQTARLLNIQSSQLCSYREETLKKCARDTLYAIADEHKIRQKEFRPDEPKFQETYQQYSLTHAHFQRMRLIPKDCDWGPYFNKTATLTF